MDFGNRGLGDYDTSCFEQADSDSDKAWKSLYGTCGVTELNYPNRMMLIACMILASSALLLFPGSTFLVASTSIAATTTPIGASSVESSNTTTFVSGHSTTNTSSMPQTLTSTFAGSSSEPFPILGFDAEWIMIGLVLGILVLYLIRRRSHKEA